MAIKLHSFSDPNRVDVGVDCSLNLELGRGGADQSYAKACDINHIMAQYQKTGMLPQVNTAVAKFQDNTEVLPFDQAFRLVQDAKNLFNELPANVRKLMDNDPKNLETFLRDPKNIDLLIREGIYEIDQEELKRAAALNSARQVGSKEPKKKVKPDAESQE